MAVEEEEGEVSLSSSESLGENSPTSEESSPEGRNRRVPFWMEDYVSGGKFSTIWFYLPQLQIRLPLKKLFRVPSGKLRWTWRYKLERNGTWELTDLPNE